jgi:hypothetical protein
MTRLTKSGRAGFLEIVEMKIANRQTPQRILNAEVMIMRYPFHCIVSIFGLHYEYAIKYTLLPFQS